MSKSTDRKIETVNEKGERVVNYPDRNVTITHTNEPPPVWAQVYSVVTTKNLIPK